MTTVQRMEHLDDELCTWPAERQLFTRANALDQWPLPITPLTQELVELPQERGLESAFVSVLGVAEPSAEWTWNACFYGYVMFGVTPAAALADNLPGWNRAGVYADYLGVRPDPNAVAEPAGTRPLAVVGVARRFLSAIRRYPRQAQAQIDSARRQLDADRKRSWTRVCDEYLEDRIVAFHDVHIRQREPHAVASVVSAALFKQLNQFLGNIAGAVEAPRLANEIITPLGGVHMREAIEAMADVRAGRMGRDEFVREYGFRGTNEFELAARTWGDDLDALDRLIASAGSVTSPAQTAAKRQARARARELAGWRWPLLERFIGFTEAHLRWRENGKLPMAMGVSSMRLVVAEAARRLVEQDRIDVCDDVFYLRKDELLAELRQQGSDDLRPRVLSRRQNRERAMELTFPEVVDATPDGITAVSEQRWIGLGLIPPREADPEAAVLSGIAGAHGVVTGRARIVTDPGAVEVDEGDILVARGTDSAWTPLFLQAEAVVVDIGGVMSHACIAAREVGIPCVIDVKHGTERIAEGQAITVDGDAGTVTLH